MRKFLPILLIVLFASPFVGIYTYLNYQKYVIRKHVKKQIIKGVDKNDLVLLIFTNEEAADKLKWEHSKEFEYKGQMYDIVDRIQRNDTVWYWCWWDYEETDLNKELIYLTDLAMGRNSKDKEKSQEFSNFLKKLYFTDIYNSEIFNTAQKYSFTPLGSINYVSVTLTPPVPPPKFV
ncbi:MAG: hypothetical protein ABIJ97_09565 [Bacteroidota bacterium]